MAGIVIRVIDKRVGYSFDPPLPRDLVVGAKTDLNLLFADILDQADGTRIETLILMSHAFYHLDAKGVERFGFGIQLGQQDIRLDNVAGFFSKLAGRFASEKRGIELRGCGAAAYSKVVSDAGVVSVGDGLSLCQAIANAARTGVLASPDAQPGLCHVVPSAGLTRSGATLTPTTGTEIGYCEVGSWTGQVWTFTPNAAVDGSAHGVLRH